MSWIVTFYPKDTRHMRSFKFTYSSLSDFYEDLQGDLFKYVFMCRHFDVMKVDENEEEHN